METPVAQLCLDQYDFTVGGATHCDATELEAFE